MGQKAKRLSFGKFVGLQGSKADFHSVYVRSYVAAAQGD